MKGKEFLITSENLLIEFMNKIKQNLIDIFADSDNKNEFYFNQWNYPIEAKAGQIGGHILLGYFFIRVFLISLLLNHKLKNINFPTLKLNNTLDGIKFFIIFTLLTFIAAIYFYFAPLMLKDVIENKINYVKKYFLLIIFISILWILMILILLLMIG